MGFGSGLITMIILFFIEDKFNSTQWIQYLVVFIAAICGLCVGNVCAKYVDEQAFKFVMQFLLFAGAINLLLVDWTVCFAKIGCFDLSVYASAGLSVLFVLVFVGLAVRSCFLYRHRNKEEMQCDVEGINYKSISGKHVPKITSTEL